jgi:hypothetical protein
MKNLLLLMLSVIVATAGGVVLEWDASPTPSVTYYIYAHTAPIPGDLSQYTIRTNVGSVTTATLNGLADGKRWYFVVTATDGSQESELSNQVNILVGIQSKTDNNITLKGSGALR